MNHLPTCDVGKREGELCSKPYRLSDGKHHWWSGWPGAYCLGCGADDPMENCMAGCKCPCHDAMWKQLEEYQKTKKQLGGVRPRKKK